jgi:D-lactate dehydrogenase
VRREQARLRAAGSDPALLAALDADAQYDSLDTCATDGLCATACPVSINTGELVKRLRRAAHSPRAEQRALGVARRVALAERAGRVALRAGHAAAALVGDRGLRALTRAIGLWQWDAQMPHAADGLPATDRSTAAAVYFPACPGRVFGRLPSEPNGVSQARARGSRCGSRTASAASAAAWRSRRRATRRRTRTL